MSYLHHSVWDLNQASTSMVGGYTNKAAKDSPKPHSYQGHGTNETGPTHTTLSGIWTLLTSIGGKHANKHAKEPPLNLTPILVMAPM